MWIESEGEAFVYNNIFAANRREAGPRVGIYVAGSPDENPMRAFEKWYKRMAGHNDEPGRLTASHNLYFNTLPPADPRATASQQVESGAEPSDDTSDWWGGYDVIAEAGFVDPQGGERAERV